MKASKAFMDTIEQYVITCADSDPIFAAKACNLMSVNLLDHIIVAEDTYYSFASSEISTFKEL